MEALATVELPGIIRIFFEKRNPNEKLLCVYEDARFYSGSDYGAQHPLQKVFEVKVTEPRSFKFKVEIPSNLAGSKLTLVGEHFPPKGYSWGPVSGYLTLKIPLLKILKK
ncbi:MAG: hypothetical protein HYR95_01230 [Candidatus Colwellbacteria bacterium]|nr:hypothetical protein [Candidatus Colwellbacteria bacterium]